MLHVILKADFLHVLALHMAPFELGWLVDSGGKLRALMSIGEC